MSTIVIMPGGFHPFHAGHAALYQSAVKAFPGAEVFVAATNDTSNRPFPFAIKEKLAKLAGVQPGHFVQVKSPFQAKEITSQFNPEKDRLIFVRSEKDADKPPQAGGVKKDGSPAYLQLLAGQTNIRPFKEHAYMAYLPTVEFGPGMTSATEIRSAWPQLNEKRKTALVMSLYPQTQQNPALAANVVKMLDTAMGGEELNEFSMGDDGEDPTDNYPCYDCGSTIFLHHTKLCDLAEPNAIRDLPAKPGSQHWTGQIPPGLTPIPGLQEGVDIGQEWMSDTELDQYVPERLQQQWRELLGYDRNGNPSALWANLTGGYEPDVRDPEHRSLMVKVANKWFAAKKIPNVKFFSVRDADDELEWLVQIGPRDVAESNMLGHVMFKSKPTKVKKIQPAVSRTKDFMKKDFSLSEDEVEEAGFDREEFRRHMKDLEAREELRKTDPVAAKALDLRGQLPQQSKKKPEDDSISINDPRHPGYAYTQAGQHKLDEFVPDDGGESRKFIPWTEFVDQLKQIVGKDFSCKENIVKSTIKARFVPHDPMEYGPTMLYSYYEARAGRNKGAISTRGAIQVGKYTGGGFTGQIEGKLLTTFSLLKGHPFERHFDLTFDNIYKIANIIQGNTQGALEFNPEVAENNGQMAGTPAVGGMWAGYQQRENQPVDEDYIEEKWSQKYKDSINCSNPKGFSQRAHCAGRKK
jgi:hypothetical protein